MKYYILLLILVSIGRSSSVPSSTIGKLSVRDSSNVTKEVCVVNKYQGEAMPAFLNKTWYPIVDRVNDTLCYNDTGSAPPTPLKGGFALLVSRGGCRFDRKIANAASLGAAAVVIVFRLHESLIDIKVNQSLLDTIDMYISTMERTDYDELNKVLLLSQSEGAFYSIPVAPEPIRYSSILLFLIATTIIYLGAMVAGHNYNKKQLCQINNQNNNNNKSTDADLTLSVVTTFIFLVTITCTLVLIYFLYKYVVIFYIFWFALYSAYSVFHLFDTFVLSPLKRYDSYLSKAKIVRVAFALLACSVSAWWGVCRHSWYAWILFDILAVNLLVVIQGCINVPNLKIATILLSIFIVYDVFFVFLTPLLFQGRNVMVDVVTGKGSGSTERLPLALVFPALHTTPHCFSDGSISYSMLGFGDVIMPGVVICFLRIMDIKLGNKFSVYMFTGLIGYVIGLAATYASLVLMKRAQPALLYLSPALLACIYAVALTRGELKYLWDPQTIEAEQEEAIQDVESQHTDVECSPSNDLTQTHA